MDLDTMLTEAAPARHLPLDAPDSPAAVRLYQQITAQPPPRPRRAIRRSRLTLSALVGVAAAGVAAAVALALAPRLPGWPPRRPGRSDPRGLVGRQGTARPGQGDHPRTARPGRATGDMLRAAGVPVNVRFLHHAFIPTTSPRAIPRSCRAPRMSDEANAKLQEKIMPARACRAVSRLPSARRPSRTGSACTSMRGRRAPAPTAASACRSTWSRPTPSALAHEVPPRLCDESRGISGSDRTSGTSAWDRCSLMLGSQRIRVEGEAHGNHGRTPADRSAAAYPHEPLGLVGHRGGSARHRREHGDQSDGRPDERSETAATAVLGHVHQLDFQIGAITGFLAVDSCWRSPPGGGDGRRQGPSVSAAKLVAAALTASAGR